MATSKSKDPKAAASAVSDKKSQTAPAKKGDPPKKGDPSKKEDAKQKGMVPPEDAFWDRYSPNSEFPFSSLASFLIHGTVLFVMLAGVLVWSKNDGAEEIEPVYVGDGDGPAGGGGNPLGVGTTNPGNLSAPDVKDMLNPDKDKIDPNLLTKPEDINVSKPTAPSLDDDIDADKMIEKAKQKMPTAVLGPQIKDALAGLAGWGKGGSGRGGGEGDGVGMGKGSGTGGNKRGRRVQRWAMILNTNSGNDYVRQLNAMGAYLGLPDKNGRVMVVRNLNERPANPQMEDIAKIGRVWWTDDRQDSVIQVAQVLGLTWVPRFMWVFFPVELENKLVEKELEYGKRFGRTKEEQISETVFRITFRGGVPNITVESQEGKRGK
jgi:hypothetical protein